MLKKYKHGKIVVLTTHFMDEADYLGDRIGIMGNGKTICCGSSLFLKNQFGVGYNIILVKISPDSDSGPIESFIKSKIPTCKKISDVSSEISFQLPMSSLKNFSSLFEELDLIMPELGVSSYGISITTMEEVFLRVAHLDENELHH